MTCRARVSFIFILFYFCFSLFFLWFFFFFSCWYFCCEHFLLLRRSFSFWRCLVFSFSYFGLFLILSFFFYLISINTSSHSTPRSRFELKTLPIPLVLELPSTRSPFLRPFPVISSELYQVSDSVFRSRRVLSVPSPLTMIPTPLYSVWAMRLSAVHCECKDSCLEAGASPHERVGAGRSASVEVECQDRGS